MLFSQMLSSITQETIEVLSKIKVDHNSIAEINTPTNIEKPKASFKSLSKNRKKEQKKKTTLIDIFSNTAYEIL